MNYSYSKTCNGSPESADIYKHAIKHDTMVKQWFSGACWKYVTIFLFRPLFKCVFVRRTYAHYFQRCLRLKTSVILLKKCNQMILIKYFVTLCFWYAIPIVLNEYDTVDLAFVFMTVNISWISITNNNISCIIKLMTIFNSFELHNVY